MDRLRIAESGRWLITPDGQPFSWLADTTWTMPQRLKWDDAAYLMDVRKSQGFTVLQIVALDPERDKQMRDPAGNPALIDGDLSKPNEAYFRYLDYLLDLAEEKGLYVLLLPVWGQLVVGDNWAGGVFEKTVTLDNAYDYACFIGNRYKDKSNILWCLGGDRQPIHKGVDYRPVWNRMAEGLAKGLTGKDLSAENADPAWKELLITYHACHEAETGECSSFSYWPEETPWITFTMLQSGHGSAPKNYELIRTEYTRKTVRPVWDGEPAYEAMPNSWPINEHTAFHGTDIVRRRAYGALLSGAFGHTYGHCSVWCSISQSETNAFTKYNWFDAIHSEGSGQMPFLRAFMDSLKPMTAIPAEEAFIDASEDLMDHIQAAISAEAGWMAAYLPKGGSVTPAAGLYDRIRRETGAKALYQWWWNPADGTFSQKDTPEVIPAEASSPAQITAPDDRDWILILTREDRVPITAGTYGQVREMDAQQVFVW